MGKCQLCGKDTRPFQKVHKECKLKKQEGIGKLSENTANFINSAEKIDVFQQSTKHLLANHYINESEIAAIALDGIGNAICDTITNNLDIIAMHEKSEQVANIFSISPQNFCDTSKSSINQAIESILADDFLSEEEESAVINTAKVFAISQDELQQLPNYEKLVKAGAIRDVLNGVLNTRIHISNHPFNLQKKEQLIWIFGNVKYYEVKTKTRYQGGSTGVSVRVMKGVYLRTGSFKGNPVQYSETVHVATGILGVTQKHIYFHSDQKSFRVPYSKIVSFHPYSDGIGIQRDAQTAKPQIFITGDGWFTNNLIQNAAQCFD